MAKVEQFVTTVTAQAETSVCFAMAQAEMNVFLALEPAKSNVHRVMVADTKNVHRVGVMATILLAINVLGVGAQVVKNAFPALEMDIKTVQCAGDVAIMIVLIAMDMATTNVMNVMAMVD